MSGAVLEGALAPAHLALFRELGDLKRIFSAGHRSSIATRLFVSAWAGLVQGMPPDRVMAHVVACGLAAARLGDLDRRTLRAAGLSESEIADILQRGFDEVAGGLDPGLAAHLRAALMDPGWPSVEPPAFVTALCNQPRAGVTCPGQPRLMLQPAENHAEHCILVAIYGVVAAPVFAADPVVVFLAGIGHHLHNAAMPDSGFTGEMLLGDRLDAIVGTFRSLALAQLPPALADTMRAALAPIAGDRTPEARAFHAADVLDRVLEIEQHLKVAGTTMTDVLDGYGLVHAGPVKAFHDRVLSGVGLGR